QHVVAHADLADVVEACSQRQVAQACLAEVEALAEQHGQAADAVAVGGGVGVALFERQCQRPERGAGGAEGDRRRGGGGVGGTSGRRAQLRARAVSSPRAALKRSAASGSGRRTLSLSGPSI